MELGYLMVRRNSSQRGVVKESVKVDAPISSLPKHLHDDVRKYIRRAGDLSVNPNRVLICACLLVAAERREECHLPKGKYVSTVQWGQLAAMLGLSDEESENHGEVEQGGTQQGTSGWERPQCSRASRGQPRRRLLLLGGWATLGPF